MSARVCAMALEDRMAEKNFSGPGKFCGLLWDQAGSSMCQGHSGTGARRFTALNHCVGPAAPPTGGLEPMTTGLRALRSTD